MKISFPAEGPSNILVTRTDRIGDLVLSTPVFSELRRRFPHAYIAGLTFSQNREILQGNPDLNEVILYDKTGDQKSWWGNFLFAQKIRKRHFDLVIHLHGTNRMHWMSWLAGIPIRIGWDRRMKWALTHPHPYTKKEGKKHEAQYNFDLLADLDIPCPRKMVTHFPISEKSVKSLEEFLAQREISSHLPWIVLSPGASDSSKTWAAEKFAALADAVGQKHDVLFFAIGALKDRPYVETLQKASSVLIHDLSGRLSLGMLGAFLKKSTILISNDSGPVHIAQAVGTPVISIFVRKEPGINAMRWRPLYENARALDHEGLSVEAISESIEALTHRLQGKTVSS